MPRINRDDVDKWFDYGLNLTTRTIYIGSVSKEGDEESGVDNQMAENVIKSLSVLESNAPDGDKPITIIMANPGGEWDYGMAIYDAIKNCRNHVTIKVFGLAMSMGAVILQAADERIISKNSKIMIHYGSIGIPETHTHVFEKWAEESKKINIDMENIFLDKIKEKNPKFQKKKLQKMLEFDTILNSTEAVQLGLADKILGED